MKYFMDTEFIDDGRTIDLISIGVVSEEGREFYRQNQECNFTAAGEWVHRNVFPHLECFNLSTRLPAMGTPRIDEPYRSFNDTPWRTRREIGEQLLRFLTDEKEVTPEEKIELWGYYSAYDHVTMCQLYGPMVSMPKRIPWYTLDLKQWAHHLGADPRLFPGGDEDETGHHALNGARWHRELWRHLDAVAHPDPTTESRVSGISE